MKSFFAILSLLILVACVPDRKPESMLQIQSDDSIIPESQMILMLADAHTIEAALLIARNKGTNTSGQEEYYYTGLFRKYGVSRERYQQNITYYRNNPQLFIQMYEKVNKELATREKNFVKSLPN